MHSVKYRSKFMSFPKEYNKVHGFRLLCSDLAQNLSSYWWACGGCTHSAVECPIASICICYPKRDDCSWCIHTHTLHTTYTHTPHIHYIHTPCIPHTHHIHTHHIHYIHTQTYHIYTHTTYTLHTHTTHTYTLCTHTCHIHHTQIHHIYTHHIHTHTPHTHTILKSIVELSLVSEKYLLSRLHFRFK
jgi:hypothetical protein